MQHDLRIIFMGTPDFAVAVLRAMVNANLNIVGVITAPDRPAGRGRKLMASAVKEYALSNGLKILQPTNLKQETFLEELKNLNANLQVVVAFRMLPKVVWQMPKLGTFNLHASLLPQYRGAAPINWAIINGEKKTGVTTFFIDEKIDTGSIIARQEVDIAPHETAGSLHDKLMTAGAQLVLDTVELIAQDKVSPHPQQYSTDLRDAPKLSSENTRIDWNATGEKIHNFIRGLSPYPTAWSILHYGSQELKVKIYSSEFKKEAHSEIPGAISSSKKELKVACADGYIYIKEIQLPGKRKMEITSLLNGFSFAEDSKLS